MANNYLFFIFIQSDNFLKPNNNNYYTKMFLLTKI